MKNLTRKIGAASILAFGLIAVGASSNAGSFSNPVAGSNRAEDIKVEKIAESEEALTAKSFNVAVKAMQGLSTITEDDLINKAKAFEARWRQSYYEQKYGFTFKKPLSIEHLQTAKAVCLQKALKGYVITNTQDEQIQAFNTTYNILEKCIAETLINDNK